MTSMYDHNIIDIKKNIFQEELLILQIKVFLLILVLNLKDMVHEGYKEIPDINDEIKVYIKSFEDSKGNFVLTKQKIEFEVKWQELI